ncbi:MAG TPA: TetR/AcrR family transcriptional regulator [Intrasporangium sp.]|nr:TetR/AcrR family transcriptional regulator [Intrasporangium sp.]
MPKLWTETVETHRRDVTDAILDAAGELLAAHGALGVTMSEVAQRARIGRATLYKYFPDLESILLAWHDRQVDHQLRRLAAARDGEGAPLARLRAVLEAYAASLSARPRHPELEPLVHSGPGVDGARSRLQDFLRGLVDDAAASGQVRRDVPVDELAGYCAHALSGAQKLSSTVAVGRLVDLILAGMAPTPG